MAWLHITSGGTTEDMEPNNSSAQALQISFDT